MRFRPIVGLPRTSAGLAFLTSLLAACASPAPTTTKLAAPPSPARPSPSPPPAAPAPAAAVPAGSSTVAETPPPAPAASPAASESTELSRTQQPLVMITARDAAFLIDYANSAPKQAAQPACERESKGDPEKLGACLTKAREQFQPDVLRFRKDSEMQTSLVVYKRTGSTLRELSVATVKLSEEGDSVRVKFAGRSKGARPIWRGRSEGTLHVPNDYSIEIDDPELGHLRYDAKIGLVTE